MTNVDQDALTVVSITARIAELWPGLRSHHGGRVPGEVADALVERVCEDYGALHLRGRVTERINNR